MLRSGNDYSADVIVNRKTWQEAVVGLDKMVYEDARKESPVSMTGFGVDGSHDEMKQDFEQVRGISKAIRL